jgi:septum site-determining protein MinD
MGANINTPRASAPNPRKRARVITVTSGKGGVGKTTTTANLGVALARLGHRVVVIDADIGLRNLDVVMGLENRIVFDLVDIVEGRCKLRQAMIKHKQFPELYLIPAAQTRDKTAITPSNMVELTNKLRDEFDFLLIDSPAGIERGFRNSLAPADDVLIVTNPEVSAVRDADRIIGLVEAANRGPAQLILNRVKMEMIRRGEMLSATDVTDILAVGIIGIVPEDESVIPASNSGVPVTLNEKSRAGMAFHNIARRLNGETVPFMQLDHSGGLFSRIAQLFSGGS